MKDFNEQIKTLKDMIEESHTIAFFTGAGISTLSGIPDFRSKNGLYSNRYHGKKPEKILHIKYFNKHPEEFYAFYREKLLIDNIDPTVIHLFISELQQLGKEVTVVTQNIDGLHEKAGSLKIHNLHGTIHRNYCVDCKKEYDIDYIKQTDGIPYCISPCKLPDHRRHWPDVNNKYTHKCRHVSAAPSYPGWNAGLLH